MILKNIEERKKLRQLPFRYVLIFVIGATFFCSVVYRVVSKPKHINEGVIFCSAENVEADKFIESTYSFSNAHTQSSAFARSGNYSCHINSTQIYGFGHDMKNVQPLQKIEVEVWRHVRSSPNSFIAISAPNTDPPVFLKSGIALRKADSDWEKLTLSYTTQENITIPELLIYVYTDEGESDSYFDDLTISVSDFRGNEGIESVYLYLDNPAQRQLNYLKEKAIDRGILLTEQDSWVKAKIGNSKDSMQEVKLRLKGDWTDHLRSAYPSYRVNTASDQAWNRMQSFSLQNPNTRSFLDEWFFHVWLDKEDVLTPRYEFIRLAMNDQPQHTYAYEEHFDKQIIEYNRRRESVIIKWDEDAMWNARLVDKQNNTHLENSLSDPFKTSSISPFKETKLAENPVLESQYLRAQDLLYQFQHNSIPAHHVFDIDLLAKYYAIVELTEAYHSTIWHNTRFYYNPFTDKLEPIGYDGFTEQGAYNFHGNILLGAYFSDSDSTNVWRSYYQSFFGNEEFHNSYLHYLQIMSADSYLEELMSSLGEEIEKNEYLIQLDFPDYKFDTQKVFRRANEVKALFEKFHEHDVQINLIEHTGDSIKVSLLNKYPLPIYVHLSSDLNENRTVFIPANKKNKFFDFHYILIPAGSQSVEVSLTRNGNTKTVPIKSWRHPKKVPSQHVDLSLAQIPHENYSIDGNNIKIASGNYIVTSPMIIPKEYHLYIAPGTQIDFLQRSYLLCYGEAVFDGTEAYPINLKSTDNTAQGITIIHDNNKECRVHHVIADGFNTLHTQPYHLTGAFTIYGSNVHIDGLTVQNNQCEDALNTVRSTVDISNLLIQDTYADGYDSDFCVGTVKNSVFRRTGNDGLDFSGSNITVVDCRFNTIGDKGVSVGEESKISMRNITIENANLGVAAKDLSDANLTNVQFKNVNQGFAAYQKKPEYGPATLSVNNFESDGVKQIKMEEKGSNILIDGL